MNWVMQRFTYVLLFLFGSILSGTAQDKIDSNKLFGSWILHKQVSLNHKGDTSEKINNDGYIITFDKGNRVNTKRKVGKNLQPVGAGIYKLDVDNKSLYQNGQNYQIIVLNDKLLVLKVEDIELELHFKKYRSSN